MIKQILHIIMEKNMRFLEPEDIKVFEQYKNMEELWRKALKQWEDAVDESNKGKFSYEETRPLFDTYLELCDKWSKFGIEHANVLFIKGHSE